MPYWPPGGGPPPGPPPGPQGPPGQDPYLAGGWGSSIGPHRRRVAFETYWELRRQAQNIRSYLAQHYKGSMATQKYADLWTMGEILDGQLDNAYRTHGVDGVNHILWYDDLAEHIMARLGAQIAYLRCGDRRVYDAIVTAKPPGESEILPSWALAEARDHSKALYNQECRVSGKAPKEVAPKLKAASPADAAAPQNTEPKRIRKRGKNLPDGAPKAPAPAR